MAKTEAKKVTRINRNVAANRAIREAGDRSTLTELAARADALFVEHGGESNPKAAAHCVMRALETAESLGVVRLVRPIDVTVEKVKTK